MFRLSRSAITLCFVATATIDARADSVPNCSASQIVEVLKARLGKDADNNEVRTQATNKLDSFRKKLQNDLNHLDQDQSQVGKPNPDWLYVKKYLPENIEIDKEDIIADNSNIAKLTASLASGWSPTSITLENFLEVEANNNARHCVADALVSNLRDAVTGEISPPIMSQIDYLILETEDGNTLIELRNAFGAYERL